ncbi:MAG: DUF3817 domain-containing protein [Bacteroidota bacterium]
MISFFRVVAFLEGLSYVLLLFVAVPIKYFYNDPQYVKLLGMPHGLLFIAYIGLAIYFGEKVKWPRKTLFIVLLASILPFATFAVDFKILKPLQHG